MHPLTFRTIDLARDAQRCIAFSRDAQRCSFGHDQRFVAENGADGDGYVRWLEARIAQFPVGHVHAFRGDELVGQVELIVPAAYAPASGYVNLFYLVPEARGLGLGGALHDHALGVARQHGARVLRLMVTASNERAWRFYTRHGWADLGLQAERGAHLCELVL
jgi:ribosomal protein S18 acetylase RimI-like enzyme